MNHNIIQHLRRRKHQQTVKIQIPLAATTPPSCLLITYCDSSICHTHFFSIICYSLRNDLARLLCKFPNPIIRQLICLKQIFSLLSFLLHFPVIFLNPCPLFRYKSLHIFLLHAIRNTKQHLTVSCNLNGDRSSVGTNHLNGNVFLKIHGMSFLWGNDLP